MKIRPSKYTPLIYTLKHNQNLYPEFPNTKTPIASPEQQSKILSSEVLNQNLRSEFQPKVYMQLGFQDLAQVLRSN